jgi:outer membrane protein assembly factor BamB
VIRRLRVRSRIAVAALAAATIAAVALVVTGSLSVRDGSQASGADARQIESDVTGAGGTSAAACGTARGYDVTDAGTLAWTASLPSKSGPDSGNGLPPVSVGGLAVFAYGNAVSAWKLAGGQRAWQRTYPEAAGSDSGQVGGLWAWHGELIVLVAPTFLGQRPVDMRVQALNPATGTVRWTADLGSGDLYNEQTISADGVLALLTETGASGGRGKLLAVSLSQGRLLWTRPFGKEEGTDGPDADGSAIIVAEHGTVTAFDDRTGAQLWSHGRLTGVVGSLPGPGGLALLYALQEPPLPAARVFPVIAVDARTGAVRWRVAAGGPVDELTTAGGLVVIGTSAAYRLTVVHPDGRVAWSVPELVPNSGGLGWDATGNQLVYVSSQPPTPDPGTSQDLVRLVARQLSTGKARWALRLTDDSDPQVAAPRGASLIVIEDAGLNQAGTAVLAVNRATGKVRGALKLPLPVETAPTVSGADTLIEAADNCVYPGTAPLSGGSPTAAAPGASASSSGLPSAEQPAAHW